MEKKSKQTNKQSPLVISPCDLQYIVTLKNMQYQPFHFVLFPCNLLWVLKEGSSCAGLLYIVLYPDNIF